MAASRPPVQYIDTPKLAKRAVDELHALGEKVPTAVDTEFDPDDTARVRLMSYSWGRGIRRVVHGDLIAEFYGDWLTSKRSRLVYQNYKADAEQFDALGFNTRRSFHADVMVMGVLVDETLVSHGLKAQSFHFLSWPRKEYQTLFAYVPVGKKRPVVMNPFQVMDALPPDALKERTHEEWRQLMLNYSGDDAESTIGLYWNHRRELEKTGYWLSYLKIDKPYTLTLMDCSRRGVRLDIPHLRAILRKVDINIIRSEHCFRAAAQNPQLNLNSIPQMKKLLIDDWEWPVREDFRTATGEPSLNREAMEWWSEEHGYELADVKLAHQNASKLKGTFLEGLINGVEDDGRLRSDLNQIGAKKTGRISSRKKVVEEEYTVTLKNGTERTRTRKIKIGANLQNIPSRKEKDPYGIRAAFCAPRAGDITARGDVATEDHELGVADYSGFELLMAIHWSSKLVPTSKMLATMKKYGSPSSIHAFTAIQLYGDAKHLCTAECKHKAAEPGKLWVLGKLSMDDWRLAKVLFPDQYLISKNNNFNLLYGGSAKMMARLRGLDHRDPLVLEACQAEADRWNNLYSEIVTYQQHMVRHGYKKGWVPTISGRRIHVAQYLESADPGERGHGERVCMNGPCQGSAADIVKVAMNLVANDEEFRSYDASLLFPVHDELVFEAPKSTAQKALERCVYLMKQPFRDVMAFELDVEGKTGLNWLAAKG